MSAITDALALLDGSVEDPAGTVVCFTHLMSDTLIAAGCENFVAVVTGTSVDLDIGGVSHRLTRVSDNQHQVVAN